MVRRDTSSVYHIDMLDMEYRENFSDNLPWIWESEGDLQTFATEKEACARQRIHRELLSLNPITGERHDTFEA